MAAQREASTTRSVSNNIATVYANAKSAYGSWRSAKVSMQSVDRNAAKMTRAYELGEADLAEVLTTRRLQAESALNYTLVRIQAVEARYRLLLDAHKLWTCAEDAGHADEPQHSRDIPPGENPAHVQEIEPPSIHRPQAGESPHSTPPEGPDPLATPVRSAEPVSRSAANDGTRSLQDTEMDRSSSPDKEEAEECEEDEVCDENDEGEEGEE